MAIHTGTNVTCSSALVQAQCSGDWSGAVCWVCRDDERHLLEAIESEQAGAFHPRNLGNDAEQQPGEVEKEVHVIVLAVLDGQEKPRER